MTTVAQLITYLQTLPQDTEVEVMVERHTNWETYVESNSLDIDNNSDFFDGVANPHVKSNSHLYGRRILTLGSQ